MRRCQTLASAMALALLAGTAVAGPLSPPNGPVEGTMKTLSEVEPRIAVNAVNTPGDADSVFRITQPGSYYLTGNVSGSASGVEIAAVDVTLDLAGYTVSTGSASTAHGAVSVDGGNVMVRNGTLRSAGAARAYRNVGTAGVNTIREVVCAGAAATDTVVFLGASTTITDSRIVGGQRGVATASIVQVVEMHRVTVADASIAGANLASFAVVDSCTFRNIAPAGSGAAALRVGENSVVRNTSVLDANSQGTGAAIFADGFRCLVENCRVVAFNVGIQVDSQSVVRGNDVLTRATSSAAILTTSGSLGVTIADNRVRKQSGGPGVDLGGMGPHVVVRNFISGAGTAITGATVAGNIIGPLATAGNPTASTNPHANYVN